MISVKRNQPRLFQQLQAACALNQPSGRFIDVEKTRSRVTCRIVSMFDEISSIDPDWQGLKSFVQVDRIGIRLGQPYQQTSYYISSLATCATRFAQIIPGTLGYRELSALG